MTRGRGDQKMPTFYDSQNQNPKWYYMHVCIWKISFAFELAHSFVLISLKLGKTVVSIEDWSCIVFGSLRPRPYEAGAGGYANMRFLENGNLTTNFSEI